MIVSQRIDPTPGQREILATAWEDKKGKRKIKIRLSHIKAYFVVSGALWTISYGSTIR